MALIKFIGRAFNNPDGTEGIATINLTLQNKQTVQINGCVIHNKEELKKFINDYNYIQKYETTKYFVYFCCDQVRMQDVLSAQIKIHRFTKKDTPKRCKIPEDTRVDKFQDQVNVIGNHIFLPLPFKYSKFPFEIQFLRDFSKNIFLKTDNNQVSDCKGIEKRSKPLKFLRFKPSHQSIINNGVLKLELSDDIFERLVDNGPLLVKDKVIGWYRKIQDRTVISVHLLESKDDDSIWNRIAEDKRTKQSFYFRPSASDGYCDLDADNNSETYVGDSGENQEDDGYCDLDADNNSETYVGDSGENQEDVGGHFSSEVHLGGSGSFKSTYEWNGNYGNSQRRGMRNSTSNGSFTSKSDGNSQRRGMRNSTSNGSFKSTYEWNGNYGNSQRREYKFQSSLKRSYSSTQFT